jgi:glycine cleavage system H protein
MSLKPHKRTSSLPTKKQPRGPRTETPGRNLTRTGAGAAPETALALGTVPSGGEACVWMTAGVIRYRLCDRGFDCEHCILDAALQGRGTQATWTSGDWGPGGYRLFPNDREFTAAHAWVQSLSSSSARMGVDALAAWLVSKIVGVRLPEKGAAIKRGEPMATLVADGGEVAVPSPVEGTVLARNDLVIGCPELVGAAPYGAGWLLEVGLPERASRKGPRLLSAADAEAQSRGQLHQFHRRVDALLNARASRIGVTMADGGQPVTDPRAMLGSALYLKLVQELFV